MKDNNLKCVAEIYLNWRLTELHPTRLIIVGLGMVVGS